MVYIPFNWKDDPNTSTPTSAANLKALESRLAAYAEGVAGGPRILGRVERTSQFSGTATTVTDIPAMACSVVIGTRPIIIFANSDAVNTTAGYGASFVLNEDGTDIGLMGGAASGGSSNIWSPLAGIRYRTPAAGPHTYKLRYINNSAGTLLIQGGLGTTTNNSPFALMVVEF